MNRPHASFPCRAIWSAVPLALLLLAACGDLPAVQCELGADGCPCRPDDRCDEMEGGTNTCEDGICRFEADPAIDASTPEPSSPPVECPAGTAGCPCASDGACEAGLGCSDVMQGEPTCEPRTLCPRGQLGCACYGDGSCDGSEQAPLACDDGACVRADCQRGQPGCRCEPAGDCDPGAVCIASMCEVDTGQTLVPPAEPRCYTPCQGDLTLPSGAVIDCDSDGLMERCIGGTICVLGSCVVPSADASPEALLPGCRTDAQCPQHQACIAGNCYSDCVVDSDCRGGRRCSGKVCRIPCETTGEACPSGMHCNTLGGDAVNGFCHTLGTPVPRPTAEQDANGGAPGTNDNPLPTPFDVSPIDLSFTVAESTGELLITNQGETADTFTVRKTQHTEFTDAGADVVDDGAMPWLRLALGDDDPAVVDELVIELGPGQSVALHIADADNPNSDPSDPAFSRWEGKLEVQAGRGGVREVNLRFARRPEGQWIGAAYFLASFGDGGLDAWRAAADKDDQAVVSQVQNALVRRWVALRRGAISLQEFLAALSAVRNRAWNDPAVRARCPSQANPNPDVGCYPSLTQSGISIFSDSLQAAPIPSGVSDLPFAVNLEAGPGAATEWQGKIVSDVALQYDGEPAVSVTFADDPETCSVETAGACLTFLEDFSADIWVGGRYRTDADDLFCSAGGDTFERLAQPWLVPGFLRDTVVDPATGERVRYECRDTQIPFGSSPAVAELNMNRAAANPVPDGKPRQRRLRLVDGAMINADAMFLLFEERFDSFLDPNDTEGFGAYGYILLQRAAQIPDADQYEGSTVTDARVVTPQVGLGCDPDLVERVLQGEPTTALDASNAGRVASALITGFVPPGNTLTPIDTATETAHYLCGSTGQFDAPCDDGSELYFTLAGPSSSVADLQALSCNDFICVTNGSCEDGRCQDDADCGGCSADQVCRPGSCEEDLFDYSSSALYALRLNPVYGCPDDAASCVDDPADLLLGKTFYTTTNVSEIGPNSPEAVHYLCLETGKLDDYCPSGSDVEFFTLPRAADPTTLSCQTDEGICREGEFCELDFEQVEACLGGTDDTLVDGRRTPCSGILAQTCTAGDTCSAKGTCTLSLLERTYGRSLRQDLTYRCEDAGEVFCDADRGDLREGKVFLSALSPVSRFEPIDGQIDQAFRYKTRFRTRAGLTLGFAPDVCVPGSNAAPYCYEPATIEHIRDRVDCITSIYTGYYDDLSAGERGLLLGFLERAYSLSEERDPTLPLPVIHDGFERLHSELMVMLGDESFTRALASRFDVAGVSQASFPGALLEPDGINLSGGAGFEMFNLYQATQYYQVAIDRLFDQGPAIWASLSPDQGPPEGEGFVTQATVTAYFSRLVVASAKKAQAWSEIAKRYQFFNRPELARLVIRRSFTAGYLESVTFARMMRRIVEVSSAEDQAQIERELDLAQRRYTSALRSMREVFLEISDEETFFGIPLSFVPFPPLDPGDVNAFEKRLEVAKQKLASAAAAEQDALAQGREFDTDRAQFQSALSELRLGFEGELADICGTFVGTDGQIYPAIARYKELNERAAAFANPCGFMGNGQLFDSLVAFEQAATDVELIKAERDGLISAIQNLSDRVTAQCERIEDYRSWRVEQGEEVNRLEDVIAALDLAVDVSDRVIGDFATVASLAGCEPTGPFSAGNCATSLGANAAFLASALILRAGQAGLGSVAVVRQGELNEIELDITEREILEECSAAQIDTNFEIQERLDQIPALQLRALQLQREVERAAGETQGLFNLALSAEASNDENLANLINVEAARNDPNVRIYRNDAVLNADRKFFSALQEAFRLTRIYEYFTSQTYAPREDLLLIRLTQYGQPNLDGYLSDLEEAFDEFERDFGNPDTRVEILSLRDDILNIPRTDVDGQSLGEDARAALFREALENPALRNPRGYLTIPFATTLDRLSPLTRIHKIRAIEAEIVAQEPGDELGRVYLTERGTGVVRNLEGGLSFTTLPERTAIVNTFFNGKPVAAFQGGFGLPSVYRNERLRDQPLVNTGWDLTFNQRDEFVNEDIRIDGLKDIVLYFFYTDFTAL